MKKIVHFPKKCIGCLACISIAPEFFEVDSDNGLSRLIDGVEVGETRAREVGDGEVSDLLVETCPAGAIEVEDKKN